MDSSHPFPPAELVSSFPPPPRVPRFADEEDGMDDHPELDPLVWILGLWSVAAGAACAAALLAAFL